MGDYVSDDESYAMIRLLLVLSNLIYVLGFLCGLFAETIKDCCPFPCLRLGP